MQDNNDLMFKMVDFRAKKRITQVELAKMCGLTVQTINSVENGKQTPSKITRRIIENVIDKGGDD